MPARIINVADNSIAEEIGIETGDILISINGKKIVDIIDYQFYGQDDYMVVDVQKPDGELWSIEIEKDYDEVLGLEFDGVVFDRMKVCKNRCIFCFVDQMPPHMRQTLYIKDDDYRYSFLYGNFITLTNLTEADWQKIITLKLSPLYISVHCIQPDLRKKMLNNPQASTIKQDLKRLQDAGIEVHTQIVLCPGVNDGRILEETINELASFHPSVISIGIVPVGLTGFRDKLPELEPVTADQAKKLIELIESYQKEFRSLYGMGLVYIADEFYLKAKIDFPDESYYDDYPQIENGIGLARIFLDEFLIEEPLLPEQIEPREVYIITGVSAQPILEKIVIRMNNIKGLRVTILTVANKFFGGIVTVTGLLTGGDIICTLGQKYEGKRVIIPEIVCREGQDILLDDISLDKIREASKADIVTVDGSAGDLVRAMLD
jgi:putative radical SAM enzyme (TIGR03279 family)